MYGAGATGMPYSSILGVGRTKLRKLQLYVVLAKQMNQRKVYQEEGAEEVPWVDLSYHTYYNPYCAYC